MSGLGGFLAGHGIVRRDGRVDYAFSSSPEHNRIVSGGLDHLLMYDGNTTGGVSHAFSDCPGVLCGGIGNHCGVLEFCAYGDGTGDTAFTDTDLHGRLVDPYSTRFTGVPYNGSRVDKDDFADEGYVVTIRHRISHISSPVSERTTVRELGWYGRRSGVDGVEYVLFSRILLDSPVVLEAGESLISTYELREEVDCGLHTLPPSAFGLSGDSHVVYAMQVVGATEIGSWNTILNRPFITPSGTAGNIHDAYTYWYNDYGAPSAYPIWYKNDDGQNGSYYWIWYTGFNGSLWSRIPELRSKVMNVKVGDGVIYRRFPDFTGIKLTSFTFNRNVTTSGTNYTIVHPYVRGSYSRSRTLHLASEQIGSQTGTDTRILVTSGVMYFIHSDDASGKKIPETSPFNLVERQSYSTPDTAVAEGT